MADTPKPYHEAYEALFGRHVPAPWEGVHARDRALDPNSALLWLPPLVATGFSVPRTEIVRVDPDALWVAIGEAGPEKMAHAEPIPWEEMAAAAARIGFPCFVRTDLSSAKHEGPGAYRLDTPERLREVVLATFTDNAIKDLASGPHPLRALLFREWLDLDAPFSAFGDDQDQHPIAHEWRIFAGGYQPPCAHFYWPEDAIADGDPDHRGWRTLRAEMEQIQPYVLRGLVADAERAVHAVNGGTEGPRWSVDWARDRAGAWWLIDMALARDSWHPVHADAPVAP